MTARLQKTLLSQRPRKGSAWISLYALALLLLVFTGDQHELFNISATRAQVFGHHEYWRAFTTTLLHADLGHLTANAVFFTGLAYLLNGYFGVWVFPLLSFIAGGLINLLVLQAYPPDTTLVGVSGVIYFMASFWLTLYFFIQRNHAPLRRGINALALALVLLFPELLDARVSYLSHAVGFALGLPLGAAYFLAHKTAIRAHEVWRQPEPEAQEEPSALELSEPDVSQECVASIK